MKTIKNDLRHITPDNQKFIPQAAGEINSQYYALKETFAQNALNQVPEDEILRKVCAHYSKEQYFGPMAQMLEQDFRLVAEKVLSKQKVAKNFLFLFVVYMKWKQSWSKYSFITFLRSISNEIGKNREIYRKRFSASANQNEFTGINDPLSSNYHPAWKEVATFLEAKMPPEIVREYMQLYDNDTRHCIDPEKYLRRWQLAESVKTAPDLFAKWGMPQNFASGYLAMYNDNPDACPFPDEYLQAWEHDQELESGEIAKRSPIEQDFDD